MYFDFSFEFAKLKNNKKRKKLNKIINEFIKENNINFKGKIIALVVGGSIIGTVAINNLNNNLKEETKYPKYSIALVNEDKNIKNETDNSSIKQDEIKEEIQIKDKENTNKTQNKNSNNTNKIQSVNKVNTNKVQNKTETNIKNEQENKLEIKEDANATYVTINRKNGSILKIELEEYIIGVVGAEMPAGFHNEALKAQAIIARTYALNAIENNKPLTDDSRTQNYKTNEELKKTWGSSYNTYYNKIKKAVESTRGMYLTYKGKIIDAVYHSTSNGKTEDAKYVWGNSMPYLVPVESPYDNTNKSIVYDKFITYEELSNKLGIVFNKETNIEIVNKTTGDRVETLNINDVNYTGVDIRNLLGLRSADFKINKDNNGITFTTTGFGHGVGLSQYGANGMAKNGYNYEAILKHYYTGVSLVKK